MSSRKHTAPAGAKRPVPARPAGDPKVQRKGDEIDLIDEDDETGEMESAGQDLGLVVEERDGASIEDSGAEDEEADDIDHDDDTDKGRGQFD